MLRLSIETINSHSPYNIRLSDDGSFCFTTDEALTYEIGFVEDNKLELTLLTTKILTNMKKITTLFAMLLLCAVTAMAQTTTVTLAYTAEPFNKNAAQGTMPSGYGSFNGQTYTTTAASGLAGLTVTASSGLTIGEQRVNVNRYGDCFKFVTANCQTDYTVTISAPDGYVVVGYYLACSANTNNQRHTLTATNGTTLEVTAPPNQNDATIKYTVFGLNEQTTSFTINTAQHPSGGTGGNTLFVPTFTVTLAPAGSVVSSVNDLSNNKKYTIFCERGALNTNNGSIDIDLHNNLAAKDFAIVNHDNNYYLWSVDDQMFVTADGTLQTYPTDNIVTVASVTAPLFKFNYGSNRMNANANGVFINSWNTDDSGNKFLIMETGDFSDMTTVEERFLDRTPYYTALAATIATAEGMSFGDGLNQFVKSADFDTALSSAQTKYADTEATIEELEQAKTTLLAAMNACTLNLPAPGLYRIKGKTSQKYVAAGLASNSKYNMTNAVDETTIFYFDGTNLINYQTGKCVHFKTWTWKYGNDEALTPVAIVDGLSYGGYAITNGVDKNNNPIHLYDNGDDSSSTDRGGYASNTMSTQNMRYREWYLEDVTTLPITLRSTNGENYFATFSAPVNVRISDATLNEVVKKTNTASYTAVDTKELPAGVGVLLTGTTASATATIITDDVADADYGLKSYYAAEAGTDATDKLYLGKGKTSGVAGFYKLGEGTTSNGFKAYLDNSGNGAKEGFDLVFGGEVTGVEAIDNGQLTIDNSAVFNLQGQRVNKAQQGVYIQNGKKVVLK